MRKGDLESENDLAEVLALKQEAKRFGGGFERELGSDDRLEFAGSNPRRHLIESALDEIVMLRQTAEPESMCTKRFVVHRHRIELGALATGIAEENDPTEESATTQAFGRVFAGE